jgi:hypothetical protein
MFGKQNRRMIQRSECACTAQEALRQGIEVELGLRIEFRQIDIDPKIDKAGMHARVTLEGRYRLQDGTCQYFDAWIRLGCENHYWFPIRGETSILAQNTGKIFYGFKWDLSQEKHRMAVEVTSSLRLRSPNNWGFGYAQDDRWQVESAYA